MNINLLFNCNRFVSASLVTLLVLLTSPASSQAQSLWDRLRDIISPPTDRGSASGRSRGGSIRGSCTVMNRESSLESNLVALIPTGNVGTTVEAYPTFWFYVPRYGYVSTDNTSQKADLTSSTLIPATMGEFMLLDDQGQQMLKKPIGIPLAQQSGFIQFTLPSDPSLWKPGKFLLSGKRYHWFFSIGCDPKRVSANPSVRGWVERLEKPKNLENQLKKTTPNDRFGIYVQAGSWYESLTLLAKHRQTDRETWLALLDQLGLAKTVDEPIFEVEAVKPSLVKPSLVKP